MLIRKFSNLLLGLCLVSSSFTSPAHASEKVDDADFVITGASIYKVDAVRSWASALAVKDGRIVFVGDDYTAQRYIGRSTRVRKLHSEMMLPGFHDCHVHPVDSGMDQARCVLDTAESSEQALFNFSIF